MSSPTISLKIGIGTLYVPDRLELSDENKIPSGSTSESDPVFKPLKKIVLNRSPFGLKIFPKEFARASSLSRVPVTAVTEWNCCNASENLYGLNVSHYVLADTYAQNCISLSSLSSSESARAFISVAIG